MRQGDSPMMEITLGQLLLLGIYAFVCSAKENESAIPTFTVVSPRSNLQPPSIEVVFPNGVHDELVLKPYTLFKGSKDGSNYIGHLKKTPESSVAVTGNLNEQADRMVITLLSKHNVDEMYEVDYFGRAKVIPIPTELISKERPMALNRNEDKNGKINLVTKEGDEKINPGEQAAIYATETVFIPPVLKAVMKIGYTKGAAKELKDRGEPDFAKYLEKVMVHVQARYNHPSLGTRIQFEIQEGFIFNDDTTWCAEENLSDARKATIDAKLENVDLTSWFITNNSTTCKHGGVVGMAYMTSLCDSNAVNVNEIISFPFTAYVMAHEMGHNFGLSHDSSSSHGGDSNPCTMFDGYDGSIGFSPCNRYDFEHAYAEEFWGHGCLEDISNPCTKLACGNGGNCSKIENGGYSCSCPTSTTGHRCANPTDPTCNGGDDCCTSENKCEEWEGDCDNDKDCLGDLICGVQNCPTKYGYDWDLSDDCCFKPDVQTTATCDSIAIDGKGEAGECVFPFYYGGIKYNNCANEDDKHKDGRWCSFDSVYNEKWGYCTEKCPNGICQAQKLDCPPINSGSVKKGTGNNGNCTFPFEYNKRIYSTCVDPKDYGGVGWCSFDSKFKGFSSDRWGYCTSNCPKTYDDPCDGIVCNVENEKCVDGICKCNQACSCEHSLSGSYCDWANSKCKCSETVDACEGNLSCDKTDGTCRGCIGQDDCCTKDNTCGVGDGDCDKDEQCTGKLRCGSNNCGKCTDLVGGEYNWGNAWEMIVNGTCGYWDYDDDCCYDPADVICTGDDSCCTAEYPCEVGEGDCDKDTECKGKLKCGSDNCKPCTNDLDCSKFEDDDDCCYDPTNVTCIGGDSCCTEGYPCGVGEGDCDKDSECEGDLKCGSDNCKPCPDGIYCDKFENDDDCCYNSTLNE